MYKDLFWQLTAREIKARYKQSVLGFAWAILVPLINLIVLSVVFSNFFRVPTGNIPYPIYLFVALVPWTFTSNAIAAATSSILSNSSLITKVYLPREILPISAISARLIDFLLTSIVLVIFLIFFGIGFHLSLIFVPIIFFTQIMLILGVSFFLSATNVFFRDVESILGVFLMVWMYLTPIIYSPQLIPERLRIFIFLNPLTGIINSYRSVILSGDWPFWPQFLYSLIISTILLILGYLYFRVRSKQFADVI